ncbi:MAG: hypothetical protein ACOVO1_07170 [Chitinophagaceae bacterium]
MHDYIFNVVTYNRVQLATESIMKLVMQKPSNSIVDVIDDCSKESLFELEYLLNEPLSNHFPKNQLRQNKVRLGVELNNINRLNDSIYDNQEFVYLTDNDVCYSRLFYIQLEKLKNLMIEDKSIFASTLFNYNIVGSCHPEIGNYNEDYVLKNSFGGVSMLIRVEDFKKAMEYYQSPNYRYVKGWDWAVCHYGISVENKKLVATKNSYVQHVGIEGENSTKERYDYANNFIKK